MPRPRLPLLPLAILLAAAPVVAAPTAAQNTAAQQTAAPVVSAEPAPGFRILPPPIPVPARACDAPDCDGDEDGDGAPEATVQGLRTVYLAFDGVTLTAADDADDARNDVSLVLSAVAGNGESRAIGAFDPFDLNSTQGLSRQEIIGYVVASLEDLFAPYNVEFTLTRPASGNYHMIVFGGSCQSVAGRSDCAGIAPLDCGDFLPSNVVFVFPPGLRIVDLTTTAAQELAHGFGLSHTLDQFDVMYPYIVETPPDQFGAGPVPDDGSICGGVANQDSHQRLLDIVGFRGQDTTGPSVSVTSPAEGSVVTVDTPITATITDAGAVVSASLVIGNKAVDTLTAAPFTFTIPADTPRGQLLLTVEAHDDSDNRGFSRRVVYLGSGDEEPCDDGQCDAGYQCVEDLCFASEGSVLGTICADSDDCISDLCVGNAGEMRCSQLCDAETACPDGFECVGGQACWPVAGDGDGDGDGDSDSDGDGGGCAVSADPRDALGGLGLFFLAVLWLGTTRRRR